MASKSGLLLAALCLVVPLLACQPAANDNRGAELTVSAEDDDRAREERRRGAGLKPGLAGLVVTQPGALVTVPYARFGSIKTTWQTIEPRRGHFDFSGIKSILRRHRDVRFRIRILAGRHAPDWMKQASGGCVPVRPDSRNGASGCIARFWHPKLMRRYARLMREVARRFEDRRQVVEVANSACSTAYAEPFILGVDDASVRALVRAGLTRRLHRRCILRSTRVMMARFDRTRVSIAGHTRWQFVRRSGGYDASWPAERKILNSLRRRYSGRLVIEDHGLGPDDATCAAPGQPPWRAASWYCYLAGLSRTGTHRGWQFTLNGGSMRAAAQSGLAMEACYLEYAAFQELSPATRRRVHEELLRNC